MEDLANGAEAYLQMWERSQGVPEAGCTTWPGTITAGGIGSKLNLGTDTRSALFSAGQPESRAAAWRWCGQEELAAAKKAKKKGKGKKKASKNRTLAANTSAKKGKGKKKKKKRQPSPSALKAPVAALFDGGDKATLILSGLRNHTALNVGPGTPEKVLRKLAGKAKRKKGTKGAKSAKKKKKKRTAKVEEPRRRDLGARRGRGQAVRLRGGRQEGPVRRNRLR